MTRRWFGRHPDDDSGYALPPGWEFTPLKKPDSYEQARQDAALAKRLAPYMQRELSALKVRGGPSFDLPKPCPCGGDCGCPKDDGSCADCSARLTPHLYDACVKCGAACGHFYCKPCG